MKWSKITCFAAAFTSVGPVWVPFAIDANDWTDEITGTPEIENKSNHFIKNEKIIFYL